MSNKDIMREFYNKCMEMDINDTLELVLNAETEEEKEFIELVSNYVLQVKQREVIAQGLF